MRVVEAPGGSRVLWRQTATSEAGGDDIESRLSGAMSAGLRSPKETPEAGAG